jgi:hypothetical protein
MAAAMSVDRSSKPRMLAAGVTHAAVVEAHRRITFAGEAPGEQQELAVTSDPVLRAADDDQHAAADSMTA